MAQRRRPKAAGQQAADREKAAAKKARRLERQAAEQAAKARARRQKQIRTAGIAVAGVVVVAAIVFVVARPDPELPGVERPPNLGGGHLAVGESARYDSATPTSGRHAPSAPRCGITTSPLALELAVHALEHGVVVVWHRPDISEEDLTALYEIAGRFDSHVIVSPNPGIDDPIVATAWNRLARYDGPGEELAQFIDVYQQRGPERLPCDF